MEPPCLRPVRGAPRPANASGPRAVFVGLAEPVSDGGRVQPARNAVTNERQASSGSPARIGK